MHSPRNGMVVGMLIPTQGLVLQAKRGGGDDVFLGGVGRRLTTRVEVACGGGDGVEQARGKEGGTPRINFN